MINPYESPNGTSGEAQTSPWWYVCFYYTYQPVWWIGAALIAGSWFGIVTPTVGWIGFALSGAAALGSYVFPSLAAVKPEQYVALDSRLLFNKGAGCYEALEQFSNGATLVYDGVAFGLRPDSEIACGVVADSGELNETSATEIAGYATAVFDKLRAESLEFAARVAGRRFRISIMSGNVQNARELCRVVDGEFDWRR